MSRNPVICHISSVHEAYDTRIFQKECRSLAAHYAVHLIALGPIREERRDGVWIHGLTRRRRRWQRFLIWLQIIRELTRLKPSLVHFHDIELMPLGVLIRVFTKVRVVYDAHEYVAEDIQDKQWIPTWIRPWLAKAVGALERWGVHRLDGTITVNDHMGQRLEGLNSHVVTVANYPLLEDPWALRAVDDQPRLVYIGGINRERGLDLLLEGVEGLNRSGANVHCVIVGPVDTHGTDERRRERLLQAGHLVLAGVIPFARVGDFLSRDSVGVLPWPPIANNVLGTPTKLFEYMAAGLAVVAPDYGFIASVVRETGCGVLYEPGNPAAFAEAAGKLLANSQRRAQMGAAGAAAVQRKYRWESQAEVMLHLYRELLGQ